VAVLVWVVVAVMVMGAGVEQPATATINNAPSRRQVFLRKSIN